MVTLDQAEAARRQGNPLLLYDRAQAAIRQGATEPRFAFLTALALAQMGETERAEAAYLSAGLGALVDEDALALRGRLLKDRALAATGSERTRHFAAASDAYGEAYRLTGGYFAAINAATTAWASGQDEAAQALAHRVLGHADLIDATGFFPAATLVEALVILGRTKKADAVLSEALASSPSLGDRAIAYRQLRWIADHPGAPPGTSALAERMRPPPVAVYAGAMFREDAIAERDVVRMIDAAFAANDTRLVFGALACGADILFAEAALRRDAELHIVLPFAVEDFVAVSVRTGGAGWEERFEACRARATSITIATHLGYMGHAAQFGHGSMLAMGLARLRATQLGSEAIQIAVWDGVDTGSVAGTAADVALWRSLDMRSIVIPPSNIDRRRDPIVGLEPYGGPQRVLRAVLFADFAGFSRLSEAALPLFWTRVMGHIGTVVQRHAAVVEASNTWGDALFAVIDGAPAAAAIALEILDILRSTELGEGAMRIGVHYGPMYADTDPVTLRRTFYGSEVTLAARIEPRVPPGQVYVTEAMAAALAMHPGDAPICRYVGRIELAKDYGMLSAYRLERR